MRGRNLQGSGLTPGAETQASDPTRFFKSVRRFSTSELRDMLLLAPEVNAAMQSPAARELILQNYVAWLEKDAMARARSNLPTTRFSQSAAQGDAAVLYRCRQPVWC